MAGVGFIIDDKGKKTDVITNLKEHGQLVEDILDSLLVEERMNEESVLFEDFVKQLKAEGKVVESPSKKPLKFGMMKGAFVMSEDFDEPHELTLSPRNAKS